MLNIFINRETGQARLAQTTAIKAGGMVPVRVEFSTNPGSNPVIEVALGPQSSEREVLAYLDVFAPENSTTFLGLLDANDTRLISHLDTKGVASTTLDVEVVVFVGGVRRPYPNFAVTVQTPTITGPETSEGGPVYLNQTQSDARYTQPSQVVLASEKGAADGVATLDSGGTIPLDQLPDSIVGQVEYKGGWDADANVPDLTDLTGLEKGWYYVVLEPGAADPDAAGRTFEPGDWLVYNGTTWDKIDNTEPAATDTLPGLIKKATAAQTNAQRLDDAAVTPANLRSQSTANLAANLTLVAASDLRQILAPQTTDRDVTLPVIAASPTGDQVGYGHCYSIIHDGSVNSLLIKNSAATLQTRLDPGESAWLCATSSGWIAVKSFRNGVVSIVYPGLDLTAAAGNTTLYTPVAGMQFLCASAFVRNDTVSGTISTPAALQIDNGTDGQGIFASATLTSPATGRYFALALAAQPRIADSANPIRLRRTVAAAGTTPVHTATIILNGVLV